MARSRLCLVLHLIDRHDLLAEFIEHNILDRDLILTKSKLRSILKDNRAIRAFHLAQYKARIRDLDGDWGDYQENELLPFRTIRNLGTGAFGTVDCVEQVLQKREIAHKAFFLSTRQEQRLQQSFLIEIQSLKRLSGHRHIVEYLGAYRSPSCLGLLLRPVATCDLMKFLKNRRVFGFPDEDKILSHSFGCLASALSYMHSRSIRHKDIKPQNILLERTETGTNLLLSDFGIALDFSEVAKSTTDGPGALKSLRYCAPEVARGQARGRRSDVYSLGCVFLEVLTVMAGYTIEDLDECLEGDGVFHESHMESTSWLSKLAQEGDETSALVAKWISSMMRKFPGSRPQASKVLDDIAQDAKGQKDFRKRLFCDGCTAELRSQRKITSTRASEELYDETVDSDYEIDEDDEDVNGESTSLPIRRSNTVIRQSTSDAKTSPMQIPDFAENDHERTYIDIAAIPRLQSGLLFSIVQGYVSLVDCLRSYNVCANIASLWNSFAYLRRRLDFEMLRLLNWSFIIGLSRGGPLQPSSLETSTMLKTIINNLNQQQAILEAIVCNGKVMSSSLRRQNASYTDISHDRQIPAISRLLLQSLFSSIIIKASDSQADSPAGHLHDSVESAVEAAIADLEEHNDRLRGLLDPSTSDILLEKEAETNLELLQLCKTFDEIVDLVHAVWPPALPSQNEAETGTIWPLPDSTGDSITMGQQGLKTKQAMAKFARFKAINTMMERPTGDLPDPLNPYVLEAENSRNLLLGSRIQLARKDVVMFTDEYNEDEDEDYSSAVSGLCRSNDRKMLPVWIEWKTYEPEMFHTTAPDSAVDARIRSLAVLLNDSDKPIDLCTPHCLGFFRDIDEQTKEDHFRYGLVFEVPSHVRAARGSLEPTTLLKTIRSEVGVPVMARMQLALKLSTSMLYLHSVNWLHKGLRSNSIIFFQGENGHANLEEPIVSGFDYSRPAMYDDMTEKPPESAAEDIYRHPRAQGSGFRSTKYRKTFDIYSLGIVLMEIAYWAPIDMIVGIPDLRHARPSVAMKVRGRLLQEEEHYLTGVSDAIDPIYRDVVKACIEGPTAFGLDQTADEVDPINAATLQAGFYRKVVRKLSHLVEGL